jgi:hypothetical protein
MVIFCSHTFTDGLPGAERSDPELIQIDTARITGSNFRTLTRSIAFSPKTRSESACILAQGTVERQGVGGRGSGTRKLTEDSDIKGHKGFDIGIAQAIR